MLAHAILDIQHAGQPSRPNDTGASYDLDSDGVRGENGEREVDLVVAYIEAARRYLVAAGIPVTILTTGSYDERHQEAIRIAAKVKGRVAYVAAHANAGGGKYGLIRPDHRSAGGRSLADDLALELAAGCRELWRVRVDPLYPNATAAKAAGKEADGASLVAWWTRGWKCIDGIYAGPANLSGVLLEPFFGDSEEHRPLCEPAGLVRVGKALAAGLIRWGRA